MDQETVFLFITFCGFAGIFIKRDFLNIMVSLVQIILGASGLIGIEYTSINLYKFDIYFIALLIFALIIFCYAIAVICIRRRSTLQVNELTELRG